MTSSGLARGLTVLGCGLVFLAFPLLLGGQAVRAEADLVEHRAVYALSLAKTEAGSTAVTNARGKLDFEWSDVCDGWAVRQRTRIFVTHADGSQVDFGWSLNAWESRDGLTYRFFIRRLFGTGEEETVRGEARLDGPGLGGTATFTEPEERTVTLPKGTLFTSRHNFVIIEAAENDALPDWRTVFDGTGDDGGYYGVNVALAKALPAGAPTNLDLPMLADQQSWRVVMAYFDPMDEGVAPSHEQRLRVFANGVVDELVLDYGDFSLDAELVDLEPLPAPDC